MKITVNSKDFADRISAVGKIIPDKRTLPALTKMLLNITAEHIYITGSNGDGITVMTSVAVNSFDFQENVKVCVDYKVLGNALKGIPSQVVELEIKSISIIVSHMSGCFSIATSNGDEYIVPKAVTPVHTTVVPGEQLIKGITSTSSCIIEDLKYRPIMSCMCIDQRTDKLAFAGFNTKSGMICTVPVESKEPWKIIVPIAATKFLKGVLNKKSAVRIDDCETHARFTCSIGSEVMSSMSISIQMLEGKYPPYEKTIPSEYTASITFDRSTITNVLDRISNFIDEASGLVSITMVDSNNVSIEGRDVVNANEAVEKVTCDCTGNMYTFNVNCKALHDILKEMTSTDVMLSIARPDKGILISSASAAEDVELRSLIMPMVYPNNPNQAQ
ncbi:MAG: hypothetical protein MJZ30_06010 [Paludibacteraceae bacterium]|nr:hypothetical protein [Paludibacteraceae bacterium]